MNQDVSQAVNFYFVKVGEPEHEDLYDKLLSRQYMPEHFVGVKTTGIACRFGCSTAQFSHKENVEFSKRLYDLVCMGYRECKICKPLSYPCDERIKDFLDIIQSSPFPERQIDLTQVEAKNGFRQAHDADLERYIYVKRINHILKNQLDQASKPENALLIYQRYWTPIGVMIGCFSAKGLCLLEFADRKMLESELIRLQKKYKAPFKYKANDVSDKLKDELDEYFEGKRKIFSVPLDKVGSAFQLSVWDALEQIPYGKTSSYKNQAITIGKPDAIRAVANANGYNSISILIPCHRVIGESGSLTGYGGGLERKQFLLDLEQSQQF